MSIKRRVLVTGASKGIGRAIAQRLGHDGFWVTGIARTAPHDLEPGEDFHNCDLTDTKAAAALVTELAKDGAFYGVVNNAAMSPLTSIEDCTVADMQDAFQLNVLGTMACVQAALPGMKSLGEGRIINFSSRSALGKENRTAYAASKAALIGMSRVWALELAPHNISVNAIAPGPVETELFRAASPPHHPRTKALVAAVPLQRTAQPLEIAHFVAMLLAPLGGYMTGQTLHIDGGLTIGAVKIG